MECARSLEASPKSLTRFQPLCQLPVPGCKKRGSLTAKHRILAGDVVSVALLLGSWTQHG
jgi:hypothetical protein